MAFSTADKGKGRAPDAAAQPTDSDTSPLLPPDSPKPSTHTSSTTPQRKNRLRHGRGPLIRDSDDEGSIGSESSRRPRSRSNSLLYGTRRGGAATTTRVLCTLLGVFFVTLLLALALLHLWIGHIISEQGNHGDLEEMAQRGVLFAGPSAVRFVDGGGDSSAVVVEVDGMAGVDVRKALDWESKDDGGWLRRAEGRIARWGVRQLGAASVGVQQVVLFDAQEDIEDARQLAVVKEVAPIRLPLSYPSKANPLPRMEPFTLRVPISFPTPDALAQVAKKAWDDRAYRARIEVDDVKVKLGGADARGLLGSLVRRFGGVTAGARVSREVAGKVPNLPGASDPSSLVNLTSYSIFETRSPSHPNTTVIGLAAKAELSNPLSPLVDAGRLPSFAYGIPFRLPVAVYLPLPAPNVPPAFRHRKGPDTTPSPPSSVLLAKLSTSPFSFPLEAKTAPLSIAGHLIPAGNLTHARGTEPPPLAGALSRFVKRYLAGKKNKVLVRYDPEPEDKEDIPPAVVADVLDGVDIPLEFPGSEGHEELFKNLKIEDMKIKIAGMVSSPLSMMGIATGEDPEGDLLCSGRVVGEVNLPPQFAQLVKSLDVGAIWPDVLVYDGPLPRGDDLQRRSIDGQQLAFNSPESESASPPLLPSSYPPNPTPSSAFARLRPSHIIPANTTHFPGNSTHNATTIISATFIDAPLYLLPGRSDVFRRFVGKIIFGQPGTKVKAGVRGVTEVQVGLGGWGQVGVEDMPIEGEFWVGAGGVESLLG